MATQLRKAEGQIEIKTNAVKFFDIWAYKLPLNYKDLCPDKLSKAEFQGGTHQVVGSIIVWNYVANGNCEVSKTITKQLDEENLSITYEVIDGNVMKMFYKSLKTRYQVIPKGKGSIVKVTYDYEKMNDNVPEADMYVDFVLGCAKDIDARLSGA